VETNFNDDILQKYMYDGLKSMIRIRIPIRLDPDLFVQIRILEKKSFGSSQPIGLRVVTKYAG
jgi:hypothetical protein